MYFPRAGCRQIPFVPAREVWCHEHRPRLPTQNPSPTRRQCPCLLSPQSFVLDIDLFLVARLLIISLVVKRDYRRLSVPARISQPWGSNKIDHTPPQSCCYTYSITVTDSRSLYLSLSTSLVADPHQMWVSRASDSECGRSWPSSTRSINSLARSL